MLARLLFALLLLLLIEPAPTTAAPLCDPQIVSRCAAVNADGSIGVKDASGLTFETASATGTTGATTATLAASANKTTFLCGFSIRATATAGLGGDATVTGIITGTAHFEMGVGATPLVGELEPPIGPHCIPASGVNTTISVVSPAPGSGGVVSVSAWGFKQ